MAEQTEPDAAEAEDGSGSPAPPAPQGESSDSGEPESSEAELLEPESSEPEVSEPESAEPEKPSRLDPWRMRAHTVGKAVSAAVVAAGYRWLPLVPRQVGAILGGLMLCASFPPWGWWWAAIPALALLGLLMWTPATRLRGGPGYGLIFGLAFYLPLLPWTGQLVGVIPWLALSLQSALSVALFGLLAVTVRRLPGWPIWFAALWSAAEWVKANFPFGGFPWGRVAFGQSDGPLLGIARYGGAPLVSFAVALVAFGLTALAVELVRWWRRPVAESHGDHAIPGVLLPGACVCLVLFVVAVSWHQVRYVSHGSEESRGSRSITAAAVQGNVPRLGLDFNAQRRAVLDYHVRETLKLAQKVKDGKEPAPQFVIWPENSSDIDPIRNADAAEAITRAAQAIGVPILVGGVLQHPDWTPEQPKALNSIIVWDPTTGPGERHDKQIIQPFGEYLPWRSFFRHFSKYADRAGYFVPGEGNGVVTANGVKIGITTCWEVLFDRASRLAVLNGAEILAVPSNNALFGTAMSEQQLAISKVRAVEHDRTVIVVGTTGISAFIAPDGSEMTRTKFFVPAYIDMQVRLHNDITPASQWGPWIEWALLVIAGLSVLAGIGLAMRHNGGLKRRLAGRAHGAGRMSSPVADPVSDFVEASTEEPTSSTETRTEVSVESKES